MMRASLEEKRLVKKSQTVETVPELRGRFEASPGGPWRGVDVVAGFACVDFSTLNPRWTDVQDIGECSDNPQGNPLHGTLPTISLVGPACVDFSTLNTMRQDVQNIGESTEAARKTLPQPYTAHLLMVGFACVDFPTLKPRQKDIQDSGQSSDTPRGSTSHSPLPTVLVVGFACVDFSTLNPRRKDVQDCGESKGPRPRAPHSSLVYVRVFFEFKPKAKGRTGRW